MSVSSSGGGMRGASVSFFERGCLTILAVGNTVSCGLAGVAVTETTLGFILGGVKVDKIGFITHLPMQANLRKGNGAGM